MQVTRFLFFLTAVILAVLSVLSLLRSFMGSDLRIYIVYSILMAVDAACMFVCGLFLNRKIKLLFWFAFMLLGLNILLTIFDQFGLIDLLFVLLNIGTLASLIIFRRELLPQ
ncbi:hypothetical protein [Candidatus Villigracilis saccharophilus]|mgnify:CR=1 FL=1|uniref:hypothetical protein n=1 Tax=Candidatus Villigracilis saccharophilus TaxID=3140684 RepID=UPI00313559A9|nr:hypothetical protein [Anaerolineales bacterium]